MKYDLILIDGNHLAYRNFHRLNLTTTFSDGTKVGTGVPFGFIRSLVHIKEKHLNDGGNISVIWDAGSKHRKELSSEYKSNRKMEPIKPGEEQIAFPVQRNLTQIILQHMGVQQIHGPGWEADDCMWSISCQQSLDKSIKIALHTGDHDMYQTIKDNVHMLVPKGENEEEVWDIQKFYEEKGLYPHQWFSVMEIMGCTTDHIQGIKGIGEKTAIKIIKNEKITPKNIEKYENAKKDGTIALTGKLVKLYNVDNMKVNLSPPNYQKLKQIFEKLELKLFLEKFEFIKLLNTGKKITV